MRVRAFVAAMAVIVTALLVSCDSGPSADPSSLGAGPLSSVDEICDGALSARDVLDRVASEYHATLTYHDRPGSTPLVIRTAYDGGAVTCEPHFDAPGPRPSRAASVTVEVRVELASSDGEFNETFVATLGGGLGTMVDWRSPTFHVGELCGPWDPDLPGYQDVSFDFHGSFDGATTVGNLVKRGQEPGHAPAAWPFAAAWRN
jgi:hypothetical protein